MKKLTIVFFFVMIGLIFPLPNLKAQDVKAHQFGGIYLTEQDYSANKLSYVLEKKDKLELRSFFEGKNLVLISKGKKVVFPKNDVFGYNLHDQDFRLYHNKSYKIIDTVGFVLYALEELTPKDKGSKMVEHHLFSLSTHDPIQDLTMKNVLTWFSTKTGFRFSLESNFKSDEDLMEYDRFSHQYKIKYLYFKNLSENN